jgi:phosphoserine phosphatase
MNHLIVQGAVIESPFLKDLAKRCGASRIEQVSAHCFRLCDAQSAPAVAALCEEARLDCALVPAGRRLADMGLVVMDMDSTFITIECIDEIADMHGIKPEIAAITAAAMRGEIDFPESLRRRVSLLAGLPEAALGRVYEERLRLSPGAEAMLSGMRAAGIRSLLVSGGFRFFTERLKQRAGLDFTLSNELEIADGKLTGRVMGNIVDGRAKAAELVRVRDELGLAPAQVIAIGDGANDLPMLRAAGVSIAYRAKPVVHAEADYAINHCGLDAVLNLFE